MKKVFITGITGFVGSHLADYLLGQGLEVHGLTRWRSPKENILHVLDDITLHHGDLLDFASLYKIIDKLRPDYVFHLAAQSFVPYSFDAPSSTLDVNVIGTCNLFEVIKILKESSYNPIIHCCSSSEVYGQVKEDEVPITEDNVFRPASPYAVSKVAEDMLGLQYYLSYGLKIIRTRMFSHTGPKRGDVFVVSNFAKQIADIEVNGKEPVIRVGNLDSIRTFADVRDTVRAYWDLVNKCDIGDVYNIGGNVTMTIREMLQKLIDLSDKHITVKIESGRLRPSDVTLQIPDISKFQKKTGWEPEISFDQTLKDTFDYWRIFFRGNAEYVGH
jgi:GDP-mannose 4,6-dehydratase